MLHASLELHKIKLVLGKAKPFEKYRGNVVFQNGKNTNVAQTIRLVSPREWHVRIFHLQNENEIKFFCHRLLAFVRYINYKMCDQSDQNVLQKAKEKSKEKITTVIENDKANEKKKIKSSQVNFQNNNYSDTHRSSLLVCGMDDVILNGGKNRFVHCSVLRCFGVVNLPILGKFKSAHCQASSDNGRREIMRIWEEN